jgi:2,4-dienoyl-CoA reductase-like NADH-dependent reductase (Old Yellow Enzyme family)
MKGQEIMQHPAFSPFRLKNHQLSNRLVVAPMSRVSANSDGVPTENMKRYYTSFAEGGFSMIITEGLYTDHSFSQAYPNQPGITRQTQINRWADIVSSVQAYGVLVIAQLMHAGSLSQSLPVTKAPSAVQPLGKKMKEYGGGDGSFPLPDEMTTEDIHQVVNGFIDSAINAYTAGFNGVEIHAANGYLLDQFLTPYTNLRNDQWGGTVTNGFRIIQQIIDGIRKVMPDDFLIGVRLSEGKVNNLYYRWPEGVRMAKIVSEEVRKAKPDYVHIAAESGNWQRDCTYSDETSYTSLVRQIAGVPVIANGGLHQLTVADKVLSGEHADLIALGSAALADPDWPKKIAAGIIPISFSRNLIKPLANIGHTWQVQEKLSANVLNDL